MKCRNALEIETSELQAQTNKIQKVCMYVWPAKSWAFVVCCTEKITLTQQAKAFEPPFANDSLSRKKGKHKKIFTQENTQRDKNVCSPKRFLCFLMNFGFVFIPPG